MTKAVVDLALQEQSQRNHESRGKSATQDVSDRFDDEDPVDLLNACRSLLERARPNQLARIYTILMEK